MTVHPAGGAPGSKHWGSFKATSILPAVMEQAAAHPTPPAEGGHRGWLTHSRPLQRMVSRAGSVWLVPFYPPGPSGSSLQLQNENVGILQKARKGVIKRKIIYT